MLYAADFRARAREALYGNWGKAVGVGFVASLLGAATTAAGTASGSNGGDSTGGGGIDSIADLNGVIPMEFQVGFMVLMSVLSFVGIVFLILHFTVGGAVTLGYVKFNLKLVDHRPASFADLFSEFHRFGAGFSCSFCVCYILLCGRCFLLFPVFMQLMAMP